MELEILLFSNLDSSQIVKMLCMDTLGVFEL